MLTSDRVICCNDQYVSKTGGGKFQHSERQLKEFIVHKVNAGIVEIEELGTSTITTRHESLLKLMPRTSEPADGSNHNQDVPPDVIASLQKRKVPAADPLCSCQPVWIDGVK